MLTQHNKLVRDGVLARIRSNNEIPHMRVLDDDAHYAEALDEKVLEESREFAWAETSDERIKEAADLVTAIRARLALDGTEWLRVEFEIKRLLTERGGFKERIFLESVESPDA